MVREQQRRVSITTTTTTATETGAKTAHVCNDDDQSLSSKAGTHIMQKCVRVCVCVLCELRASVKKKMAEAWRADRQAACSGTYQDGHFHVPLVAALAADSR
jgi:hypothetical protein